MPSFPSLWDIIALLVIVYFFVWLVLNAVAIRRAFQRFKAPRQ